MTLVSLSFRLKDLLGHVRRVQKKKEKRCMLQGYLALKKTQPPETLH